MYQFELITPATDEVVAVEDLKDQVRYLANDRDLQFAALGNAAVDLIQIDLRRQLLSSTWKMYLDRFPAAGDPICIPKCPVQSISSITYLDGNGDSQTLSASVYQSNLVSEPALVRPAYLQSWPVCRVAEKSVAVTFVAGYGDPDDVPEGLKHAIRLKVEGLFDGRESELAETISALLMPYKYQLR